LGRENLLLLYSTDNGFPIKEITTIIGEQWEKNNAKEQ
jgi:hypothetical protein